MTRAYLDHNATAPVRPEVAEAVLRAGNLIGNPSSIHAEGRAARAAIELAREQVAALVGARPRDVIFTGGGSEANTTLLSPALRRAEDKRATALLLCSAGEHASVLNGHRFGTAEHLPLDGAGRVDVAAAQARIEALATDAPGSRLIVAVQAANSETGVLQPVADIADAVRAQNGLTVCDAIQAAGKIPVDIRSLGVDALTISGHKFGGPKGIGAIALKPDVEIGRLIGGGGQEMNRRAGTENVAGIVGLGVAATIARETLAAEAARVGALRDQLEERIGCFAPEAVIFGRSVARLPNTTMVSVPGLTAETLLMSLDLAGFAVSSGSACSSGKVGRSHVLEAMNVPGDLANGALRISLGWTTTADDIVRFLAAFEKTVATLYERRARAA